MLEECLIFIILCLTLIWSFGHQGQKKSYGSLRQPALSIPLLGHLPWLAAKPHLTLCEWAKKYGNIYRINMGTEVAVVVTGLAAVRKVLNIHCTNGRPTLTSWKPIAKYLPFINYSNECMMLRKICLQGIHSYDVTSLPTLLDQQCGMIVKKLAHSRNGVNIQRDVYLSIGAATYLMCFGESGTECQKELNQVVECIDGFLASSQAANFIDVLPWSIYVLPKIKSSYNKYLRTVQQLDQIVNKQAQRHKAAYNSNSKPKDLLDMFLKVAYQEKLSGSDNSSALSEDIILNQAGAILGAGLETTSTTINWSLLLLAKYPDIQDRIIAEMNEKLDITLTILADHRSHLPYLEAFILEVLRFTTLFPVSIPHLTLQDVELDDIKIPKDTSLLLNLWSANHDELHWVEPEKFDPQRFLSSSGEIAKEQLSKLMTFGYGKRRCIGEQLGKLEVFLFLANMLRRCKIRLSENSKSVDVSDFINGLTIRPTPYNLIGY